MLRFPLWHLGWVEIIFELVGQLILLALNLTVGFALAAACYWVWVTVRRRVWGLDKPVVVRTPAGDPYTLAVPGLRVRTPFSRRVFGVGRALEGSQPEWSEADRLHPKRVAGAADDLLIFVVPFLFVGVLVLALLFVLEFILAAVVVGLVSIVASIVRHHWTCRVTDPAGRVLNFRARGMRRVRRLRDEMAEAIRAGDVGVLQEVDER